MVRKRSKSLLFNHRMGLSMIRAGVKADLQQLLLENVGPFGPF